ncbi:hypothetical protein, partial [Pantoea dispersa]
LAFALQQRRRQFFAKRPSYMGAKFFNQLVTNIREKEGANLKNELKRHSISISSYLFQEFIT